MAGRRLMEKWRAGVQIGTCTNRWYDKLQIIVAANGTAGVNFEHSSCARLLFRSRLYGQLT